MPARIIRPPTTRSSGRSSPANPGLTATRTTCSSRAIRCASELRRAALSRGRYALELDAGGGRSGVVEQAPRGRDLRAEIHRAGRSEDLDQDRALHLHLHVRDDYLDL